MVLMRELINLDGFLLIQAHDCFTHQGSQLLILFHPGLCQLMLLMHLIKALLAKLNLFLIGKLKIFLDLGNLIGQLLAHLLQSLDMQAICKQLIASLPLEKNKQTFRTATSKAEMLLCHAKANP